MRRIPIAMASALALGLSLCPDAALAQAGGQVGTPTTGVPAAVPSNPSASGPMPGEPVDPGGIADPGGLSLGGTGRAGAGAGTGVSTGSGRAGGAVTDPRQLETGRGTGGGAAGGAGISGGAAGPSPSDEYLYPLYGRSLR